MRFSALLAFLVLTTVGWSQKSPVRSGTEAPVTRAEVQALLAQQKAEHPAETPPDLWGRGLAIIAATVGIIQSYFIFKTLKVTEKAADAAEKSANATERAVNDSQGAAEQTLALTKQAADAATDSAKTAREALVATERAYIAIENVSLDWTAVKGSVRVTVSYKNGGRTNCVVYASFLNCFVAPDLPLTPDFSDANDVSIPMARDQIQGLHGGRAFTEDDTRGLLEGTSWIYITGILRYRDVFGIEHETVFARRWEPERSLLSIVREPAFNYAT